MPTDIRMNDVRSNDSNMKNICAFGWIETIQWIDYSLYFSEEKWEEEENTEKKTKTRTFPEHRTLNTHLSFYLFD